MLKPAEKEVPSDDLDAGQVSQIVALAEFDGRYIKPPDHQQKKEESVIQKEEPKPEVKEPDQLPRAKEPEVEVEEKVVDSPVDETHKPDNQLVAPPVDEEKERLQKQNEALMKLLNEQAGGNRPFAAKNDVSLDKPAAKPAEQPAAKPGEPIKFVDAERFQKVFESPDELNVLLNEVYQKGQASAPAQVDTTSASDLVKMEIATAKYFDENPDLERVRQYVAGQIPRLLEAEDAPKTFKELLIKAGDETRTLLHMPVPKQVAETDVQPNKGNQKVGGDPAFAPAPGGPRGGPSNNQQKKEELTPEQKQIKEMMAFKERI